MTDDERKIENMEKENRLHILKTEVEVENLCQQDEEKSRVEFIEELKQFVQQNMQKGIMDDEKWKEFWNKLQEYSCVLHSKAFHEGFSYVVTSLESDISSIKEEVVNNNFEERFLQ